jgi:hypothetical protein
MLLSLEGRHCESSELFREVGILHVWGHELSMGTEVHVEGATRPPALDPHCVEWDFLEEVFQGGPDSDAVSL